MIDRSPFKIYIHTRPDYFQPETANDYGEIVTTLYLLQLA
jgi:hypothetical protein